MVSNHRDFSLLFVGCGDVESQGGKDLKGSQMQQEKEQATGEKQRIKYSGKRCAPMIPSL